MPEIATGRRGLPLLLACLIASSALVTPAAAATPERDRITYAAPTLTSLLPGRGSVPDAGERDLLAQQDPQVTAPDRPVQGGKSPWLALGLSTLLAGGGQFYNGDWLKGAGMLVGQLGGIVLFFLGGLAGLSGHRSVADNFILYGGLSLAGGLKLWSMVDAPLAAMAINRRIEEEQRLSFGFGMSSTGQSARVNLSF